MHERQQRTVPLVGQLCGVGSGSDREERDGNGRRGSVEQTERQLQQEDVGDHVRSANCMYPKGVKEVSEVKAAIIQWEES